MIHLLDAEFISTYLFFIRLNQFIIIKVHIILHIITFSICNEAWLGFLTEKWNFDTFHTKHSESHKLLGWGQWDLLSSVCFHSCPQTVSQLSQLRSTFCILKGKKISLDGCWVEKEWEIKEWRLVPLCMTDIYGEGKIDRLSDFVGFMRIHYSRALSPDFEQIWIENLICLIRYGFCDGFLCFMGNWFHFMGRICREVDLNPNKYYINFSSSISGSFTQTAQMVSSRECKFACAYKIIPTVNDFYKQFSILFYNFFYCNVGGGGRGPGLKGGGMVMVHTWRAHPFNNPPLKQLLPLPSLGIAEPWPGMQGGTGQAVSVGGGIKPPWMPLLERLAHGRLSSYHLRFPADF